MSNYSKAADVQFSNEDNEIVKCVCDLQNCYYIRWMYNPKIEYATLTNMIKLLKATPNCKQFEMIISQWKNLFAGGMLTR